MFTVSERFYRVGTGSDVTIFGGVFGALCKVIINGTESSPLDVSAKSVTFSAPGTAGKYSFTISDGTTSSPECRLLVVPLENSETWRMPVRNEGKFLEALAGLCPRGSGWDVRKGTNFYKLLSGFAVGFLKVYESLCGLALQMSPLSSGTFGVWENELGLPRKGLEQTTDDGRRREIVRVARRRGGCTIPHYKQILDLYGADYEIFEYFSSPEEFPDWVKALGDDAYSYAMVRVYGTDKSMRFTCVSKCNESLGFSGDETLEALVNFDVQAHVKFIFTYLDKE